MASVSPIAAPAPLSIGPVVLAQPLVMAPMAGITDPPFRKLVRRYGASLAASEMTTADTRLWETLKSRQRLNFDSEPSPRVVQIAGSDPAEMAKAAIALEGMGADIIDINMGCPAKKVCRKLAGSALLQDERLVGEILSRVVAAVSVPVTLKTRTGTDPENRNIQRVAQIAVDSGVSALAVHGRTRACRYQGFAEYDSIRKVADTIEIPLFANGDINSPDKALEVMRLSGADGLMIGRAAHGRPWIFRDLVSLFTQGFLPEPLPITEVRDMILDHLDDMHRFYGEEIGVRVARKHLNNYCRHFANSESFRQKVLRADNAKLQSRLTKEFLHDTEYADIAHQYL